MDKSNGEYISFLNANEFFINEHSLKEMYDFAKMKNANVVTANAKLINKNNKFSKIEKLEYYEEYDKISSTDYTILESLNKNIIKKEFLKENNIKFQNLSIGYDSIFLAEIPKYPCFFNFSATLFLTLVLRLSCFLSILVFNLKVLV